MTALDVTDATFQAEVLQRSFQTPVVVDLWAPWCGPCRTLGPIIEKVIDETQGKVVLAKVNVDENPNIARAFQAQSIPAVHVIIEGQRVDGFIGAQPEPVVRQLVESLLPSDEELRIAALLAQGTEESLREVLALRPDNEDAIVALGEMLVERGESQEALQLLARIPETERTRKVAAAARLSDRPADDYDRQLEELLDKVKGDDEARQQFVDILEVMGPDDPRTAAFRRKLTARLY